MDLFKIIKATPPKSEPVISNKKEDPPEANAVAPVPPRVGPAGYPASWDAPYHTGEDKYMERYRLINAICNVEFKNSMQRAYFLFTLSGSFDKKEVNCLMAQYAPRLCNKVMKTGGRMDDNGHLNHIDNLRDYVRK